MTVRTVVLRLSGLWAQARVSGLNGIGVLYLLTCGCPGLPEAGPQAS